MSDLEEQLKREEVIIDEKMVAIEQRKEELKPEEQPGKEFALDLDQTGLRWGIMQLAGLNAMSDFLAKALKETKRVVRDDIKGVLSQFQTLDSTPIIQNLCVVQKHCYAKVQRKIIEQTLAGEMKLGNRIVDHPEIEKVFKEGSQKMLDLVLGGKEAYSRARDEKFGLFHTFAFTLEKLKAAEKKLYAVSDSHRGKFLRRLKRAGIDVHFELGLAQADPVAMTLPHYVAQRALRGAYKVDCKDGILPNIKPNINFAEQLIMHSVKAAKKKNGEMITEEDIRRIRSIDDLYDIIDPEDLERIKEELALYCIVVGDNVNKDGGFARYNKMRYYKAGFGQMSEEMCMALAQYGNKTALSKNLGAEDENTIDIIKATDTKMLKYPTDILIYTGIPFDINELHEYEINRARAMHEKKKARFSTWSQA